MTFLVDILNPPPVTKDSGLYKFLNDQHQGLNSLRFLKNDSVLTNSDFNTLSAAGLTPTTQADGDNFEFIGDWFVFGASNADYTITPTVYPANSTVKSASAHYVDAVVTSHNGDAFYFYQRQTATVRKYQKDYFTYGINIKNNQNKAIKVRLDIFTFYDPTSKLTTGKPIYLQPGNNLIASTLLTDTLDGITVGAGNYTEFRFNFIDLFDGTADIEMYQLKCEPGQISTPL
jgi:hypothetical protein